MRPDLHRTIAAAWLAVFSSACAGELTEDELALTRTLPVNGAVRLSNQNEVAVAEANPTATPLAPAATVSPDAPQAVVAPTASPAATVTGPTMAATIPVECANIQATVLTMPGKCGSMNCHGSGSAVGDFSVAPDSLVDAPSLAAGACAGRVYIDSVNPDQSLILTKLGAVAPCGLSMPLGVALAPNEDACLRAWVTGVAGGERP